MNNSQPHISIIAGPNGAGKSTCGPFILKKHFDISEFVNADTIAAGLSAFCPEDVAIEAGRIMLKRIKSLAHRNIDFAFETTLASRSFAPWLRKMKEKGYQFTLVYFWLHTPELAIERVAERVRMGGHYVLSETVKRRYGKSIKNFFELYQPIADHWGVFDNSDHNNPQIIAEGNLLSISHIYEEQQWNLMKEVCDEK